MAIGKAEVYSVSNPHPDFGKNDNVANEFGHTVYPKMVYPHGIGATSRSKEPIEGVIAENAEHEAELMKDAQPEPAPASDKKSNASWGKSK